VGHRKVFPYGRLFYKLKFLTGDKRSSLLCRNANDEDKKLCIVDNRMFSSIISWPIWVTVVMTTPYLKMKTAPGTNFKNSFFITVDDSMLWLIFGIQL